MRQTDDTLLGAIEVFDDHVVVRALTNERGWRKIRGERQLVRNHRKFVLDTAIEGVRLLLRVNGLHHATVQHTPDGFRVDLPALPAGEAS